MPFGNPPGPGSRSLEGIINGDCRVSQIGGAVIGNPVGGTITLQVGASVNYNCIDNFAVMAGALGAPVNVDSFQSQTHPILLNQGFSALTSALGAIATAGTSAFVCRTMFVETLDFIQLLEQPCVLQFWARTSLQTGNHYVTLDVGTAGLAGNKFIARYVIQQLNTWEQFFIPVTFSDANLALPGPNSRIRGLAINWPLCVGTNLQTANPNFINSWLAAGTTLLAANDVPQYAGSGANFRVTDVSLAPGIEQPPFARLAFNDVLQRAKRYYQQTFPYGWTPAQAIINQAGGSAVDGRLKYSPLIAAAVRHTVPVNFGVEMINAPAVTFYNPEAANTNWRNETLLADSGAPAADQLSAKNMTLANPQVVGDAIGNTLTLHASFDARMT